MKLLSPNSSSRQIGLILFGIAFVAMGGVALLIWGGLYVMLEHPPFSWVWILSFGLAFGLLMYLTTPSQEAILEAQEIRRAREPVSDHHPVLGAYLHWPGYGTWSASPALLDGKVITLLGHGSTPSEAEVRTWYTISREIASLVKKAESALLGRSDPSTPPGTRLKPTRVELASDGAFAIDFDCISSSANFNACLGARYSATLELLGADWEF